MFDQIFTDPRESKIKEFLTNNLRSLGCSEKDLQRLRFSDFNPSISRSTGYSILKPRICFEGITPAVPYNFNVSPDNNEVIGVNKDIAQQLFKELEYYKRWPINPDFKERLKQVVQSCMKIASCEKKVIEQYVSNSIASSSKQQSPTLVQLSFGPEGQPLEEKTFGKLYNQFSTHYKSNDNVTIPPSVVLTADIYQENSPWSCLTTTESNSSVEEPSDFSIIFDSTSTKTTAYMIAMYCLMSPSSLYYFPNPRASDFGFPVGSGINVPTLFLEQQTR